MLIAIRADASSTIGLGHLRRCLSLAQALRETGAVVRFVMRESDVDAAALVHADGFDAHLLSSTTPPDRDAAAFCDALADTRPAWAVVDHYTLDARWHAAVRGRLGCRVAAIDDLADRPLDVDALIDHNFVPAPGHRARYAPVLARAPAIWLCGPRFALLGEGYANAGLAAIDDAVASIGIFLGGTDPADLTRTVIEACRDVAGFTGPLEIASTSANPRLDELRSIAARDPALTLSIDQPDLAAFHARHGLQVGAGGGATWERCCIGVPTLTLCVAANQLAVIPALRDLGAIATVEQNDAASIGAEVARLLADPAARRGLSAAGRALVDGRGASRAALALAAAVPGSMQLRDATMADARTMWQWRNAPVTRHASRLAQEIPFDAHEAWLARTLADPARHLFVARIGRIEIGVIRFDRLADDASYEVSLYLDPELHGIGLGHAMLAAGEAAMVQRRGALVVHAEVLSDNPGSRRLFIASGYGIDAPTRFTKTLSARTEAAVSLQESNP